MRRLGGGRPSGRPPRLLRGVLAGRGSRTVRRRGARARVAPARAQSRASHRRSARAGRHRSHGCRRDRRHARSRPDRVHLGGALGGSRPGLASRVRAGRRESSGGPPAGRQPGPRCGRAGGVPVSRAHRLWRAFRSLSRRGPGRLCVLGQDPRRRRRRGVRQGREDPGPRLSRGASHRPTGPGGNPRAVHFPRARLRRGRFDLSFSGFKTAVWQWVRDHSPPATALSDVAASVQEALVDMLVDAATEGLDATGAGRLVVSGGVSANRRLRERMFAMGEARGVEVIVPRPSLCTDNAAMIALAGWRRLAAGDHDGLDLEADAALQLGVPWQGC